MKDIKSRYLPRLESDIESLFDYDPAKDKFMGMFGQPLDALYLTIEDFSDSFEERTEAFFILFKEMLRRGHLKLQKDGVLIEHTPEEWEAIFRAVWPKTESPYGAYEGDICIWFTDDPCPAYAVWVDPDDGSLYWAG